VAEGELRHEVAISVTECENERNALTGQRRRNARHKGSQPVRRHGKLLKDLRDREAHAVLGAGRDERSQVELADCKCHTEREAVNLTLLLTGRIQQYCALRDARSVGALDGAQAVKRGKHLCRFIRWDRNRNQRCSALAHVANPYAAIEDVGERVPSATIGTVGRADECTAWTVPAAGSLGSACRARVVVKREAVGAAWIVPEAGT